MKERGETEVDRTAGDDRKVIRAEFAPSIKSSRFMGRQRYLSSHQPSLQRTIFSKTLKNLVLPLGMKKTLTMMKEEIRPSRRAHLRRRAY